MHPEREKCVTVCGAPLIEAQTLSWPTQPSRHCFGPPNLSTKPLLRGKKWAEGVVGSHSKRWVLYHALWIRALACRQASRQAGKKKKTNIKRLNIKWCSQNHAGPSRRRRHSPTKLATSGADWARNAASPPPAPPKNSSECRTRRSP